MASELLHILRYPVKGLTAEALSSVAVEAEATLPFDRLYAIENGRGHFNIADPGHVSKLNFVMLAKNEQLASLGTRFDDATHTLIITKGDIEVARGDLRSEAGRAAIEDFYQSFFGDALRGAPRVVSADGHAFTDVEPKCVHLINLTSLRDLEGKVGATLNPLRFRPNLIVDGLPAWSEFDLVGKRLRIGDVALEVFKRTERCAATNVDPVTAVRDHKIPSFLSRTYGHTDFGVYARFVTGGTLRVGDRVVV